MREVERGGAARVRGPDGWGSDVGSGLRECRQVSWVQESRLTQTGAGAQLVKHSMPCNPLTFQKLSTAKDDKERDKMRDLNYLQLIGSLLYLTNTRPDVC